MLELRVSTLEQAPLVSQPQHRTINFSFLHRMSFHALRLFMGIPAAKPADANDFNIALAIGVP